MAMVTADLFCNPDARGHSYLPELDVSPKMFHSQLPNFSPTPLTPISIFSNLDHVYVKDESERLGLPSFKVLGASWGVFRTLVQSYGLSLNSDLQSVREVAQKNQVHLVTATDGNHGRALAWMARLLGIEATVFVPSSVNDYTRQLIRSEGAKVLIEFHDYDAAVISAFEYAKEFPNHLFVQDTSFKGYHEIPRWIVQGYATMFQEVEEQLNEIGLRATHIFAPVGVGSLAHAVVAHSKAHERKISVVAVESEVAACLQTSLRAGQNTPVSTKATIMDGINCGTVSDISWPVLRCGVDGVITVSDDDSHIMVQRLRTSGINAGPCGASTSAALRKLLAMPEACAELAISRESVIVLLNTEGPREYAIPA